MLTISLVACIKVCEMGTHAVTAAEWLALACSSLFLEASFGVLEGVPQSHTP